jgi:hypothetical protein
MGFPGRSSEAKFLDIVQEQGRIKGATVRAEGDEDHWAFFILKDAAVWRSGIPNVLPVNITSCGEFPTWTVNSPGKQRATIENLNFDSYSNQIVPKSGNEVTIRAGRFMPDQNWYMRGCWHHHRRKCSVKPIQPRIGGLQIGHRAGVLHVVNRKGAFVLYGKPLAEWVRRVAGGRRWRNRYVLAELKIAPEDSSNDGCQR